MREVGFVLARVSAEFEVKVGVHQGSILSFLLFMIVLEASSREFRAGVPWEDLQLLSKFFIDSVFCHNYLHTLYLFACLL